ncbi:phytanoyl-CoA dioxygenase family protein [Paenibacillus koleovorans]|uniref:phytanoyl-CoA dioxygenase family protein n=1 Tax=Paenibacillus koleovorans TaxID=121608 RepID=UPI000FDAC602|nr:phytanoyl-CoA dioxygenase family protein [Paenibacillus koleovorans]
MSESKAYISESEVQQFRAEGYLIVRGLFGTEEVEEIKTEFMQLHQAGPVERLFHPVPEDQANGDILKQYPRFMHPHRVNELSMRYMIHPRVMHVLHDLFGEEALAAQSMFYYKPPGARGQALHQDNFYLLVEPGTCIAAWTSVDRSDEDNGGLYIVPRTHEETIQCPNEADPSVSFTTHEVVVPDGCKPVPVILEPGDVLFFNGNVIHGSYPNTSKDRFRRSFICHYTGVSTTKISNFYSPLYTEDGTAIHDIEHNGSGGPCGEEYAVMGPH